MEETRSRDLEDGGGLLPWFVVSVFSFDSFFPTTKSWVAQTGVVSIDL
jgi:hypothetical protein